MKNLLDSPLIIAHIIYFKLLMILHYSLNFNRVEKLLQALHKLTISLETLLLNYRERIDKIKLLDRKL